MNVLKERYQKEIVPALMKKSSDPEAQPAAPTSDQQWPEQSTKSGKLTVTSDRQRRHSDPHNPASTRGDRPSRRAGCDKRISHVFAFHADWKPLMPWTRCFAPLSTSHKIIVGGKPFGLPKNCQQKSHPDRGGFFAPVARLGSDIERIKLCCWILG